MVDIMKEMLISEKELTDTSYERLKNVQLYRKQFDTF